MEPHAEVGTAVNAMERLVARSEIADLVSNYNHGCDKRDRELFGSLWADDAVWEVPTFGFRSEGRANITAAIDQTWEVWGETHHWTSNLVVTFVDADHAVAVSDVNCDGTSLGGAMRTVAATFDDAFARTPAGWRFTRRVVNVHWFERVPGVRPTRPDRGAA